MITRKDVMPIPFLKKERFTGSDAGVRYKMEKTDKGEEGTVITCWVWPEPYAFDFTEESLKLHEEFPFNEDGICQGVDWINSMREQALALKK